MAFQTRMEPTAKPVPSSSANVTAGFPLNPSRPPYFAVANGFPRGASATASASNGADLVSRRAQINTLRIFNERVAEVTPDVQYRVEMDLPEGQEAALVVFLPPNFPRERPTVALSPADALKHPWLDQQGAVTGAPGLIHYTAASDLGRLVQVIRRELEKAWKNGSVSAAAPAASPGATFKIAERPSQPLPSQHKPAPLKRRETYISMLWPELNALSNDDLRLLASDDGAARHFCRAMKNPTREKHAKQAEDTREDVERLLRWD